MQVAADRLVEFESRKRARLVAVLKSGQWSTTGIKKDPLEWTEIPSGDPKSLWWGESDGNRIRPLGPAIQLIDYTATKVLRAFADGGVVREAKAGPAVLQLVQNGTKRWFGPVNLRLQKADAFDAMIESKTGGIDEIEPQQGEISIGRLLILPHGWEAGAKIGALASDLPNEFYDRLSELLRPEVEHRLSEIRDWSPGALARLGLDADARQSLSDEFVDRMLLLPAFKRKYEGLRTAEVREAELQVQALLKEKGRLSEEIASLLERKEAEIEGVRERKRDEIRLALGDILEDDRALALVAALGLRMPPSPPPDLSGIERKLEKLATRPEAKFDIEPVVKAIKERPAPDLALLAEAVKAITITPTLSDHSYPRLPALDRTGIVIDDAEDLQDAVRHEVHRALLIIAHARGVGIVVGARAPETVNGFLRLAIAERAVWWPVPADLTDVRQMLDAPEVQELFERSRSQPERRFGLVLEGVDRAPTEAYLEPLLVLRDLNASLPYAPDGWPQNLLLVATASQGGRTLVPIAPGVWERAVPLAADGRGSSKRREIGTAFWNRDADRSRPIELEGLLPQGVKRPANVDGFGRSSERLDIDVPLCLAQGIAAAACLARGDETKPLGGVAAVFPSLFR